MTSLSPQIQSVLELFKGPLASVRFADIDATGLANLAAEVEAVGSEAEEQEAKLAELRQDLAQKQEALLVLAQRALAYARVYAENDEPLLEELNRIALPRAAKPRKPSAAKATHPRDAARSARNKGAISSVKGQSGDEHDAEGASAEEPSVNTDPSGERVDTELNAAPRDSIDKVEAAPRPGKKSRGSAPQRTSN
jgi:hypothetical protein